MSAQGVKTGLGRGERLIAIFGAAGLSLVLVLFHVITIGSAVIATGQVVVQGKPRPVQSLENGVVRAVAVQNGDNVAAGDVVVGAVLGIGWGLLTFVAVRWATERFSPA